MIGRSITTNLRNNLAALQEKSNQLATGRNFNRPSQDPVGTYKTMQITGSSLQRNEQFRRNIGEGLTWLTVTENALADATEAIHRLRELAIAAGGALSPGDREAIAPEVKEILRHLVSVANTELGGLYIFGGHQTQAPPYTLTENPAGITVTYDGDGEQRLVEIAPAQQLAVNLTGTAAFDGTAFFQTVETMRQALLNNDTAALGGTILSELDNNLERLIQSRAESGARLARLSATEQRLLDEHIYLRELRSRIEDIDLAGMVTEFTMQENAYQAALATSARMIFPSLVDFLK
jgi:flagellar hook-associated protein 3 FlgL